MHSNNNFTAILITGAAGGLGQALVYASLSLDDVDYIIATDLHDKLPEQFKGLDNILYYRMDVRSEKSIRRVKKELDLKEITIKYLINNAGANFFYPISESTEELLDSVLKVNLYGPVLTVSSFLDHLAKKKGRVVQISSDAARLPIPFHPYPSSKIALEAFSISMRRELKLLGCDLILIRPGAIQTQLVENMKSMRSEIKSSKFNKWFYKFSKLAKENIGKTVQPEEVANLVIKVLTAKKPKQLYHINKNKQVSFFSYFPEKKKDKLIIKNLKTH